MSGARSRDGVAGGPAGEVARAPVSLSVRSIDVAIRRDRYVQPRHVGRALVPPSRYQPARQRASLPVAGRHLNAIRPSVRPFCSSGDGSQTGGRTYGRLSRLYPSDSPCPARRQQAPSPQVAAETIAKRSAIFSKPC